MRILLLVFGLCIASSGFSQNLLDKEISIQFTDLSIEKCLTQLEKVSGISFSYNSRQLYDEKKKVSGSFQKKTVGEVLDVLLMNTALKYEEIGNQITIYALRNDGKKVVLSGYVREKRSGEGLIGARVYFPDFGVGCISNSFGYYAVELPLGTSRMRVNSLGMLTLNQDITIREQMVFNIDMETDTVVLNVVEVSAKEAKDNFEINNLSQLDETTVTPDAISKVPPASGERDLLRHLQQIPGVQPSSGGTANYIVRGSGTGGNLMLIDGIPIYHPTHLLGIYSIVNTDALKSATLYKDYIPLQYGSRNSSVLQINTKDGDLNRFHFHGGISGFMARANLEGPIIRKKASFYTSIRGSTIPGALLAIMNQRQLGTPSFFDFNNKINIKLNSNNRIYLTGYIGRDRLINTEANTNYLWGNTAYGIRWNHIINPKTFSNLTLTHSEFIYGFDQQTGGDVTNYGQRVVTDRINYNVTKYLDNTTKLNYGLSSSFIRTDQGSYENSEIDLFLKRQAYENGIYASVEKKFSPRLKVKAGIRIPISFHVGTGDTTAYLQSDYTSTQIIYEKDKVYDPLFFIDPRAIATYRLTDRDQFQASAMITSQNTHIINYTNYFLPIEVWTPSTGFLKPQRNFQLSAGWTHIWGDLNTSAVVYNRFVNNVIDYASPVFTTANDIENNLLSGTLNVAGIELMANYKFRTWYSASVSYAFMHTRQRIQGINNDLPYSAPGDRPHYFSFSQFFNLTEKWQITTNFIAHSGAAVTLPNGQFTLGGTAFPLYSSVRNADRLRPFRRVDISFRRQLGIKSNKRRWDLALTITNLFNRYNTSVAYVEQVPGTPEQLQISSVDYSPTMVTLNLNFRF